MKAFLQSFSESGFMPHGHCYLWRSDILWTHVLSDVTIAMAYYLIPVVLGAFLIKHKQSLVFHEIIALFIAFIFLCGTTHLMSIYVTWFPAYELEGWTKALTALVSITTAIVLIPKLPKLVTLPGIQQAYEKSQQALQEIKAEKKEMQSILEVSMGRESRILALKEEVNELLLAQGQPRKYLLDEADNS